MKRRYHAALLTSQQHRGTYRSVLSKRPLGCVDIVRCIFVRLSITFDVTLVAKETKNRNTVKHVLYCFQISSEFYPCRHRLCVHHFTPRHSDSEARAAFIGVQNEMGIEMFYKTPPYISHYSVHGTDTGMKIRRSASRSLEIVFHTACRGTNCTVTRVYMWR